MYWTLELASYLEDAPWPATKDELIDYAIRSGAPLEVVENLQELEDDGEPYETIEEIWPDYPTKDDFFFNEDEYSWRVPRLRDFFFLKIDDLKSKDLPQSSITRLAHWDFLP